MSTNLSVNLSLTNSVAVTLVLITGCGGTFAVVHRNQPHTRQADPEAIELHVIGAAEGSTVLGTTANVGPSEATGEVEGSVMLGAASDAEAFAETGNVDGDHSEEISEVDDGDTSEETGKVDDGTNPGETCEAGGVDACA